MPKEYSDYIYKYTRENYDTIKAMTPKGTKEKMKQIASARGLSVNALLNQIILDFIAENETNETDAQKTATPSGSGPEEKQ